MGAQEKGSARLPRGLHTVVREQRSFAIGPAKQLCRAALSVNGPGTRVLERTGWGKVLELGANFALREGQGAWRM